MVPGGTVSGTDSFHKFQEILTQASQLETGFVVLQHDLYQQTVDLAIGYTLRAAQDFQPKLTVRLLFGFFVFFLCFNLFVYHV